jgi:hypothetical protein
MQKRGKKEAKTEAKVARRISAFLFLGRVFVGYGLKAEGRLKWKFSSLMRIGSDMGTAGL